MKRLKIKTLPSIIFVFAAGIVLFIAFYFLGRVDFWKVSQDIKSGAENIVKVVRPTPSPFPFEEITLPYLKSRTYDSSITKQVVYSEDTGYTSYLASYDSDGLNINGLLTIPKGDMSDGGWPAIVFVHGYVPPATYETTKNYVSYVDYLARSGFVVFKIDLRGHGESDGEAGGGYYSGDYVVDTLNAAAALSTSNFVDSKRIGLWGHSMAGNVTFRSFVASGGQHPLVVWAGAGYTYTDLSDYSIHDTSYRAPSQESETAKKRARLREIYGSFDPDDEFWKQVPATNYLDGAVGKISLQHAVDDPVVSIKYSRNLMSVLERTKIEHSLDEYPTGGHNISGESFNRAMDATVKFFQSSL